MSKTSKQSSVEVSPPCPSTAIMGDRLIGAHMPTAGGLSKSLTAGHAIGCTAVQLFTGSPRQWAHPPLDPAQVIAFHDARESTGIRFTVAHDSYLINLAAPSLEVLERSRAAFRDELDRAEALGIPWVVTHMGAHLGQGEDEAVARLVESLLIVLEETDTAGYSVGVALETTAGQGTGLGATFDQLGKVIRGAGGHERLGVCLDTCHIHAAGYDLRSADAYQQTWKAFETHIGLQRLKVIHANDAKKPLGSRVDRHAHIGEGELGDDAFAMLLADASLMHVPVILETPDSETMHAVNLTRLRRLAAHGSGTVSVRLLAFGHYSGLFSGESEIVSVPSGTTVAEAVSLLAAREPLLKGVETHCRFAVNEEYVSMGTVLQSGDTLALLPPMSGG